MFNFFKKKKPEGTALKLKISGMHCSSCAMNIDGALEDVDGVLRSETNYAKSEATILFDPKKTKKEKLVEVIKNQGYNVVE